MTIVFWESFTPFNPFGEPLPLIAKELSFWAIIALAFAFAVATIAENGRQQEVFLYRLGAQSVLKVAFSNEFVASCSLCSTKYQGGPNTNPTLSSGRQRGMFRYGDCRSVGIVPIGSVWLYATWRAFGQRNWTECGRGDKPFSIPFDWAYADCIRREKQFLQNV